MERAGELAAERSHELRNGLAGITHLLSTDGGADHERLKHAVLAELGRLHRILDGEQAAPPVDDYLVGPVLDGLVSLRDPAPTIEVECGLHARGDPAVLAQVVTNLLANCDRHAPGAPVRLDARQEGAEVVVEVRDEGPGLPPHRDAGALLGRGVRDESAGGPGLGLYISGELLAREGGSLELRPATDPAGCVATVRVPATAAGRLMTVRRVSADYHQS
jgi:two-component system OmpR family sensor kinase